MCYKSDNYCFSYDTNTFNGAFELTEQTQFKIKLNYNLVASQWFGSQ